MSAPFQPDGITQPHRSPSGGTTGLKSLTRVLEGNNRQFLSVIPTAILTYELGRHHSTIGVPDGPQSPFFPPPRRPSAAAQVPDPKIQK